VETAPPEIAAFEPFVAADLVADFAPEAGLETGAFGYKWTVWVAPERRVESAERWLAY
jgi:hypothetical protein